MASCFTHFALVPDSIDLDLRRHGILIALRELFFALTFFAATLYVLRLLMRSRSVHYRTTLVLLCTVVLYSVCLLAQQAFNANNSDLLIAGRVLLSVLATLVIPVYIVSRKTRLQFVRRLVSVLLCIELVVSLLQLMSMDSYYGATFLGARVVGTFALPLHVSLFAGAASMIIIMGPRRHQTWLLMICGFLCLASGGRAGMMMLALALLGRFAMSLRQEKANVLLFILCSTLSIIMAYILVSNPALSGREGTSGGLQSEARLTTWVTVLQYNFSAAGLFEWLFGVGLGTGSNTAAGQAVGFRNIADSTFLFLLLSYGLIGLVLLGLAAFFFWNGLVGMPFIVFLAWFLAANTQSMPELHPSGFLLLSAVPLSRFQKIQFR